jgi:hypothetical protein
MQKIKLSTKIYNNLSVKQIIKNLPVNMIKQHKKEYLKNCLFVYHNEKIGANLGYCKLTREANFLLIKNYLSN